MENNGKKQSEAKSKFRRKTILCYGDSNTWGYNPHTGGRFGYDERWPGVLRRELGEGFVVIEEGLNHRTTIWDDPIQEYKNGKSYLIPCLESHKPIDVVAIMLGSNDLKARFHLNVSDIAEGAGVLAGIAKKSATGPGGFPPKVILMSPPPFGKLTELTEMFSNWEKKYKGLPHHYHRVAKDNGCHFIDTSEIVACPDTDGIHLGLEEHEKLGLEMASRIQDLF